LNLFRSGPLLIRHSTCRCWRGLLMLWGANEESCGEVAHWFFATTTRRHILRFECRSFQQEQASPPWTILRTLLTCLQLTSACFRTKKCAKGKAFLGLWRQLNIPWEKNFDKHLLICNGRIFRKDTF
jgi:hypothetical protein